MGMHITVEVVDAKITEKDIDSVYKYFMYIDETFSMHKETSEISQINAGKLHPDQYSSDMKTVLGLCEQTKHETEGYFDMKHQGKLDPTGIVKGWAIWQASKLLEKKGFKNFYIDAGGDIQTSGKNNGRSWTVGIRNPFNNNELVKVVSLENMGIATSGTAERGQHIYNPHNPDSKITEIVSLSVIAPNVYEADRFATAAFAMGKKGIHFIEKQLGLEGYVIDKNGTATFTSKFNNFVN